MSEVGTVGNRVDWTVGKGRSGWSRKDLVPETSRTEVRDGIRKESTFERDVDGVREKSYSGRDSSEFRSYWTETVEVSESWTVSRGKSYYVSVSTRR